ncbi:MAG: 2OG-Fe(II) oxygenase [Microthrixaceae bacterium]
MSWPSYIVQPDAFSGAECDEIQRIGHLVLESGGPESAGIEGLSGPGPLRETVVAWIPRGEDTEWIFERMEMLSDRCNQAWGLAVDGIVEDLQYTLYEGAGAHYTWHQDGLDDGVDDRKLSLVVQLSDSTDYTGGDLEFLEVTSDYDPAEQRQYHDTVRKRGTAIGFTAFEYHRVTPLRSGTRRSLVAWISGPRLR